MTAAARQYQPGELVPGTIYRVLRHLATGGMGSVYDVEDTTVGKRYVLKTLHPNLVARADLARRMAAEARTLGRLSHTNIVEVVTAGQTADVPPLPYYVMERLNGQNLRSVLEKRGALPEDQALPIAIELLDALDHAHEHQVVHRDVKPENIFLHRSLTGAIVTKLLDFGIMRMVDESRTSDTAGRFVGTLRYAAPEQLLGSQVGPGTDLYAAAIVIYEMLAGKGPFDDSFDISRMGYAHLNERPTPLSKVARVSPEVERVVMAGLEKDPTNRPRDAFTFAGQLKAVVKRDARTGARVQETATDVHVLSQLPAGAVPARPVRGSVDLAEAVTVAAPQPAQQVQPFGAPLGQGAPNDPNLRPSNRPPHDPALPFAQTAISDVGPGQGFAATTPDAPRGHASTLPSTPAPGNGPAKGQANGRLVDRQAETRSLSPSAIEAMGIGSTEKLATGASQVSPEVDGMHAEIDRAAARAYAAGVTHPGSTTTSGAELAAPRKDRPVWPFFVVGMIAMLAGGGALMKLVVVPRLSASPKDPATTVPLPSAPVAPATTPNPTERAGASTTGSQLPAPHPSTLSTTLPTASASSKATAPVVPKGASPKPTAPRPTPAGESPDVNL